MSTGRADRHSRRLLAGRAEILQEGIDRLEVVVCREGRTTVSEAGTRCSPGAVALLRELWHWLRERPVSAADRGGSGSTRAIERASQEGSTNAASDGALLELPSSPTHRGEPHGTRLRRDSAQWNEWVDPRKQSERPDGRLIQTLTITTGPCGAWATLRHKPILRRSRGSDGPPTHRALRQGDGPPTANGQPATTKVSVAFRTGDPLKMRRSFRPATTCGVIIVPPCRQRKTEAVVSGGNGSNSLSFASVGPFGSTRLSAPFQPKWASWKLWMAATVFGPHRPSEISGGNGPPCAFGTWFSSW